MVDGKGREIGTPFFWGQAIDGPESIFKTLQSTSPEYLEGF